MRTAKDLLRILEQQTDPETPNTAPSPVSGSDQDTGSGDTPTDSAPASAPTPAAPPNSPELKILRHFKIAKVSDLVGIEVFYQNGNATIEAVKGDKIEMDTYQGKRSLTLKEFYELVKDKIIESISVCPNCGKSV